MGLYFASLGGQETLRLQLDPPITSTVTAYLLEWQASSETEAGGASWPNLTRETPLSDTLRISVVEAFPRSPSAGPPQARVYTNFDTSTDARVATSNGTPIYFRWTAPSFQDAPVVGVGGGLRLVAYSDGAHTWRGHMLWEEA